MCVISVMLLDMGYTYIVNSTMLGTTIDCPIRTTNTKHGKILHIKDGPEREENNVLSGARA